MRHVAWNERWGGSEGGRHLPWMNRGGGTV
jgi:hypothetical protein